MSTQFVLGGILGLTGVIAGAVGSHHQVIPVEKRTSFLTGSTYQILHGITVIGLVTLQRSLLRDGAAGEMPARNLKHANWLFITGATLFGTTIYIRGLAEKHHPKLKWLGPIAALGGFSLIGGWCCVAVAALRTV